MKTKIINFLTDRFPAANQLIIQTVSEEIMNLLLSTMPSDMDIHRESSEELEDDPIQSFFNGAM